MSFLAYFGIGMLVLFIVVMFGFLFALLHNVDYWSPAKKAARSARKALRDAQL